MGQPLHRSAVGPALGSFPITPGTSALPENIRQITISGAGVVVWEDWNGVVNSTASLPAGSYPCTASKILASGTDARTAAAVTTTATGITGWI